MADVNDLCNLGLSPVLAALIGSTCGTTAAAGTVYADAAVCNQFDIVTGANAGVTDGVKVKLDKGQIAIIRNVANAVLKVYTAGGSADSVYIAGTPTAQTGDTAITVAAYYTLVLINVTGTSFIALELVGA